LTVQNRRYGRGKPKFVQINKWVNRNLLKLQGGKAKFAQITGSEIFHKGLKPKNLQITRMKFKKNILQGENQK